MAAYKRSAKDGVIRTSDGTFIARNTSNSDWQTFLAWQAAGGILDAADIEPAEYEWYIDIGPFFDRFGSAKLAVLTSTNPIVKAVVTDVMVRKWVDLKSTAVSQGFDALIAQGVSGVTQTLKDSILNTPVTTHEQSALVKLYFH